MRSCFKKMTFYILKFLFLCLFFHNLIQHDFIEYSFKQWKHVTTLLTVVGLFPTPAWFTVKMLSPGLSKMFLLIHSRDTFWGNAFEPSEELDQKKKIYICIYVYISFRLSSKIQLGNWSEEWLSLTMSIYSREKGSWRPSCSVPISYCLEEE